jgi:2-methylcitrate dehydratase PrpD
MTVEYTKQLIQFAYETKYEDIPKEHLEFAKALTMKTVAGMVAGSRKPAGIEYSAMIKSRNLQEDIGVIGGNFKTSKWEAVLTNAILAHACELEDDRLALTPTGGSCWDITVIPPMITLAVKLGLSGKTLLEIITLAMEVHARTCFAKVSPKDLSMIPGAVGPAVGIAKAMGLNADQMAAAAGLALSGVPLTKVNFGTDAHYLESALCAMHGVIAAEMAGIGLKGNPDVALYMKNFGGKEPPERMTENLGDYWRFHEIWIKKYPVCFHTHRQIDALIDLIKEHNISYDDVEAVEVDITHGEAHVNKPDPRTEGELQFSLTHVLGCAILDGDVKLEHITPEGVDDPRLKEARSKIKQIFHDVHPDRWITPARVTVKMKDGREFSRERSYIVGSLEEPLTMEQIRGLYTKFTSGILPDDYIEETADSLMNLESLPSVDRLIDMLVFCDKR